MTRPVLGLYGLEQLGSAAPPAAELVDCALESGAEAVLIDFPELMPRPEEILRELRDILPRAAGRIKLYLSCPAAGCACAADYLAALDGRLAALGVGSAHCAVFGPVSMGLFRRLEGSGFREALTEALSSGRIAEAGLWIADRVEYAEQAAQLYPMLSLLRLDYTPLDYIDRPGAYGFKIAERYGLSVLSSCMHGGAELPAELSRAWAAASPGLSLSSQLIRWRVMAQPGQLLVLAPRTAQELRAQLQDVSAAEGMKMTVAQKLRQNNLRDICRTLQPADCTACGCCMPCPFSVDIPGLMAIYNDSSVYETAPSGAALLGLLGHDASACRACGRCVEECPRHNRIPEAIGELAKWPVPGKQKN